MKVRLNNKHLNIDPLKEVLGFELDNTMQDYQGEDFNQAGSNTLYIDKSQDKIEDTD